MNKGRTKKPCDGCGEVPEWTRLAGKVCGECRDLMADGEAYRKYKNEQANSRKTVHRFFPSSYYGLPFVPKVGIGGDDEFQKSVFALAEFFSVPGDYGKCDKHLVEDTSRDSRQNFTARVFPTRVANGVRKMYAEVLTMVDAAYESGKADGGDFIRRLASGGLTVEEINEHHLPTEEIED